MKSVSYTHLARKAQKQGDWMKENNIKTNLSVLLEYTYNPDKLVLILFSFIQSPCFCAFRAWPMGYP